MHPNVAAGWAGMIAGVVSGALIGAFFHRENFLQGYDSFPRRLVRLGHISFLGLGILNVLYGLTFREGREPGQRDLAGTSMIAGAVLMPTVCFLTAWRKPMRHLFALPVAAVLVGVAGASSRSLRERTR
jgi:hypothetical protein